MPIFPDRDSGTSTDLLARTVLNPATTVNASTTSSSLVVLDAGAAVTFTVPASGEVLVVVSLLSKATNNGSDRLYNLHDGTGQVLTVYVNGGDLNAGENLDRRHVMMHKAGLTPGASLTWTLYFAAGGGTHNVYWGRDGTGLPIGSAGPLVMEVYDAGAPA